MPLRRLEPNPNQPNWDKAPCISREHNPPSMIVLPNGRYEYTCPTCGQKTYFFVNRPSCQTRKESRKRSWSLGPQQLIRKINFEWVF